MAGSRNVDDARSLKIALITYAFIFAIKLGVYVVTGVMALLAEALHTLSDLLVSGFLLFAIVYSRRRPDDDHMFGHGRAQNVAGLIAATLFVSFTSYKLYEEAVPRLFRAGEAAYDNLGLAMGVLVVSMLIAAAPIVSLLRQRTRGAAAKAQLTELFNDELGLTAALAGTVLLAAGHPVADPIASIAVATLIAWNAIGLLRENASFLMGRSPGAAFLGALETTARSVPGVVGVHDLRAEYVGPDTVNAGLHLEVDAGLSVREANRIADEVRRRVHEGTDAAYCIIQVDAAPAASKSEAAEPVAATI